MEIDTRVFRRIVSEARDKVRSVAIVMIADTMEETVRFGTFSRPYVEDCAIRRMDGKVPKNVV